LSVVAERPRARAAPSKPFTLDHFRRYCSKLTLDNGSKWELEPFQEEIAADILAGYREVWVIIPEGNAKTTLLAGVALYHADFTPSPWVPVGAASRDQAEILFGQAAGFVERSKDLQGRFRVYEGYRKIKCHTGGKGIKVYAYDPKTGDGVIPTLALVDELHRHDDLRLYRLWKGKLNKRGGQIVTISTAGEPGAPFEEMRETIREKASDRRRDGAHLRAEGVNLVYHEWMVEDRDMARDIPSVKAANPLAGIDETYLGEKLTSQTLDFGEDWLRLTCNIPSRSTQVAIPESDWDACQTSEEIPEGVPIGVGADFAWLLDTTALAPLWIKSATERVFGDPAILEPPRDGTMLDAEDVKSAFRELNDRNPIEYVVMDKTKAEDIGQWLENDLGCEIVHRGQENELFALDYTRWMEAIGERWIRHTGHLGFRRHVLNAIARRLPNDRYRFDRPSTSRNTRAGRQERRVIDALTAASMVHSFAVADLEMSGDPVIW
jgi:phage terminase large subunit-like protein